MWLCCLGQDYEIQNFDWPSFLMSIRHKQYEVCGERARVCGFRSHLLRCGAHGHFDVITLSWLSTKVVNHVYKTHPTDSSACPGDSRGAPGGRGLWQGPLLQRDTEQQWVRAASGGAAREKGHQCPWTQKHSRHPHLYTLENPFV